MGHPVLGRQHSRRCQTIRKMPGERKGLAVVSIAGVAILIRIALLWLVAVSPPSRIANSILDCSRHFYAMRGTYPIHPMQVFLDTIRINQQSTSMSKYPRAQGAVLALGQLLGEPRFGVVLSAALMGAAVLWILRGWLHSRWVLLGGVLV